ncbi:holo-ACP synthase [Bacillus sp. FJAT-45037]|uniref:holo-ACP synthase n=1 Tax=Bacillus sp. FJAT-45037 TaxID=2011007 RepID=UPI000C245F65|nr:holo-ACP synthase [Bacillus sp. FJAT-45037]
MIIGIGVDIIELDRIKKAMDKQPRFLEKILTKKEQATCCQFTEKRLVEYIAGRFAAKEAFVKAAGTGISATYGWHDIEVLNEDSGKPVLHTEIDCTVHLSISHSESNAIAQVILERLSS